MSRAREVLVCVNRSSGGASLAERKAQQIRHLLSHAGLSPSVELLAGSRIAERVRDAVADKAKLIVVGGGDGSVSAAAGVLAGTPVKLGILPLGTFNHFARDLGIPTDLAGAARLIASGRPRRVDVAEVNGRTFINNSAIGLYPLMVTDRESQQRRLGRSKRLAMLVAAARTLARFDRERLTLTIEGQKERVETPLLFVGNNEYRVALPSAGTRKGLADGKLVVFVLRRRTRAGFLLAALRVLLGRARSEDLERLLPLERLRVDSPRRTLPLSLDGEATEIAPPLTYRIRKQALQVIAP